MKKYVINCIILAMIIVGSVVYGIVIHKYKVFPYIIFKKANYYFSHIKQSYDPWSIGIYEGSTPFDLIAPEDVSNPVLTGRDVIDINAKFVLDPFMMLNDNKYYMFFQAVNRKTNQGDIAYAESQDGKHWKYQKVILDEKFHLSYPYIFSWEDNYYLIPESHQDLSVRLYKAVSFPDKWTYVGNLLTGYHYIDPSIFRYNNKWWLFVNTDFDNLNLYYSNNLLGEWKPHPMNPVVKFNKNIAKSAGRVITDNGQLYRMAMDDEPDDSIQVFAFLIYELTEESYSEKIASQKPIVKLTEKGWNAASMHHVDLHKIGDVWIAAVDGRNR